VIHTVYIDQALERARKAATGNDLPQVGLKIRTEQTIAFAFTASGTVAAVEGWVSGKAVIKEKPTSPVLLIDAALDAAGAGEGTRYNAVWTAATLDGPTDGALRQFMADETQPKECWCEVEWIDAAGTHSASFPITLIPTFNDPEDEAPDPALSASWDWLKNALLAGSNVTLVVDDTAKTITIIATGGGGGGSVSWGDIGGTLASQTDLIAALNAKLSAALAATTYQPVITDGALTIARTNGLQAALDAIIAALNAKLSAALAATTYQPVITDGALTIARTAGLQNALNAKQASSANLTTYSGITPSANVQILLSAADYAAIKTLLSLGNVENTALSAWAGSTNITTLGTIVAGVWNGSIIPPAYLGSGSGITAKFLRGDGTWQTVSSSGATWGAVTGTLADQTDLQAALDAKQATITDGSLTIAKTNGLQSALDAKQATITDGSLTIARTSGLQSALNGKLDASGGSASGLVSFSILNSGTGAYNFQINHVGTLTDSHTLTFNLNDSERVLSLSGNLTISADATVSGTNTGDQTSVTGNAGTATALATGRTLAITGDLVWTSPSFNGSANVTAAGTLATVNSNVGSFGSATAVPAITVNAKGLITAVTTSTVTPAVGSITGLGTGIAAALAINTGSAGAPVLFNGALGTPSSGTLTNCTVKAEFMVACSDETTALTTGTAKVTFRMPHAMTLSSVRLSVNTAPTGSVIIVDVKQSGSTIFSTKPQIATSAFTSVGGAVPGVLSTTSLTDDAEITINLDQIGSTIAGKGLKVTFIGTRS